MADEDSLLVNPPTQDVAIHVRDYTRFISMLKWGAGICLVIALIVLMIL
ncbi:hypothetical protein [Sphingomonas sp. URHD0057]|nr:hypothetical protein [Sphingomonas sp. URHD0057]